MSTFRSASLTLSANCPQASSASRWNSNSDPTIYNLTRTRTQSLLVPRGSLVNSAQHGGVASGGGLTSASLL